MSIVYAWHILKSGVIDATKLANDLALILASACIFDKYLHPEIIIPLKTFLFWKTGIIKSAVCSVQFFYRSQTLLFQFYDKGNAEVMYHVGCLKRKFPFLFSPPHLNLAGTLGNDTQVYIWVEILESE